jgi:multiple sugar transport system permease protein
MNLHNSQKKFFTSSYMRTKIFPLLLILPAIIPLILIIVLPAILTIQTSFQRSTFGLPNEFIGFKNYIEIFKDKLFISATLNTVKFSFLVVIFEIGLGLLTAVIMSTQFKMQKMIISLIMIPYAVSEVVAVIIWKYMLDPDIGIVNFFLVRILGMETFNWAGNPVQAWIVIILLRVWINFPFSFLIIYSSIIGIPQELYESAYIDGATNPQSFRFITLPLVKPSIMVATIFAFIFAFRNFATVWLLTRGGPMNSTQLLSTILYKQAFSYWEFGLASATAIIMTVLTFIIAIYYLSKMRKQLFTQ